MNLVATYEMIKGYKHRATNYLLAISEFIDNSIASYTKNKRENSVDGLEIYITFDYRNCSNRKLIIRDNANGMDKHELEQAMQPNIRTGKRDTQYNQYGVGMKLGIFWYGENVTIFSKKSGGLEYCLDLNTRNVKLSSVVEVNAIESNCNKINTNSGTIIEINYLYENRCEIKSYSKKFETLVSALGCRYSRLLSEDGMNIKLTILEENGEETNFLIYPYIVQPMSLQELFDPKLIKGHKNATDKVIKIRQDRLNAFIDQPEKCKSQIKKHNYSGLVTDCDSIFDEAFNKFINGYPLKFERMIKINGQETKLTFGVTSLYDESSLANPEERKSKRSFSDVAGVTIFHLERAILHAPNSDENKSSNIQFISKAFGISGATVWRRLYGYLDLTGIEIPFENKYNFDWSLNGKQDLIDALFDIYKQLEPILMVIVDISL